MADMVDRNIWVLFVRPGYEAQGIGKRLQQLMPDWYFQRTSEPVWLSAGPGTRARTFHYRTGWHETGRLTNGEVKFEMTAADWQTPAR
ncbi:MAG: hypothetical protein ACRYFX_06510 [Janthinobacterium lividum]